ncbi:MAG TPA: hypothetical protein VIT42_16885 [Microlunatus sp.]
MGDGLYDQPLAARTQVANTHPDRLLADIETCDSRGRRGRRGETRTFKTTFSFLRVMRDWLVDNEVTIAAMESTLTYSKPPYYWLEEGLTVWLLNAARCTRPEERHQDRAAAGARAACNEQAQTRRLLAMEKLGHTLVQDPAV